jgi:hypothetical protein
LKNLKEKINMPQRFLKPGITNSSRWNRVSFKAQSLFVRLLTLVDDFGRYDGRPSVIWGYCFSVWNEEHPNDAVSAQETAALCQQLAAEDLIEIYEADGKKVVQIIQWTERARSNTSKWPENKGNSKVDSNPLPNPAESCEILPPSPSSSSSSPPSSSSSKEERETLPQIPPMSKVDFDTLADARGIPMECSEWFWNIHDGRNWTDATGQIIRKVEPLLLNAHKNWQTKTARGNARYGKPQLKPNHEKGF